MNHTKLLCMKNDKSKYKRNTFLIATLFVCVFENMTRRHLLFQNVWQRSRSHLYGIGAVFGVPKANNTSVEAPLRNTGAQNKFILNEQMLHFTVVIKTGVRKLSRERFSKSKVLPQYCFLFDPLLKSKFVKANKFFLVIR